MPRPVITSPHRNRGVEFEGFMTLSEDAAMPRRRFMIGRREGMIAEPHMLRAHYLVSGLHSSGPRLK
ncbi:hypothetical protein D3C72_1236890 [compost metagenome]